MGSTNTRPRGHKAPSPPWYTKSAALLLDLEVPGSLDTRALEVQWLVDMGDRVGGMSGYGECRKCGKEFTDKRPLYAKGMHKSCYEVTRISDTKDIEEHIERLNDENGDASTFACYWCSLYLDESNAAVAWLMDEAACVEHLKMAEKWARFALRTRKR